MTDVYELEVEIDAPRERVWRALTDPRELESWFCEHAEVSLDEGRYDFWGRYTPDVPAREDGTHKLTHLEPQRRLGYTWRFRGGDTTVEITLEDDTRLHVVHSGVPEREQGGELLMSHFWGFALADLRGHLELGRTAPRFDYSWPHMGGFEAHAEIDASRDEVWAEHAHRWELLTGQSFTDGSSAVHPAGAGMKLFDVRPTEGWSWEWNELDPPRPTVMTYTLADSGGRTRLEIVHSGFDPDTDVQGMATGFFSGVRDIALALQTGGAWPAGSSVRVLREPRHGPADDSGTEVLAQVVRGRSDEEISEFLTAWGGADQVLRLVFEGMRDRIDARSSCVVGFDVGAGFALRVAAGTATVEHRLPEDADAVVRMTTQDFLRMIVRELPAPRASSDSRMSIDGDPKAAERLFSMLPAGGDR